MSPPPTVHTEIEEHLTVEELRDTWSLLTSEDRVLGFKMIPYEEAEDFFFAISSRDQADLVMSLPPAERRGWMRLLPPDDAADLLQEAPHASREELLSLIDDSTRAEVQALMAYAEDVAGGLMDTRYARLRPDMTAEEAIRYLRKQVREYVGTMRYVYVLDDHQKLLGVVAFRQIFGAPPETLVRDVMRTDVISVTEDTDQEEVSRLFARHSLNAVPVVDSAGRMKGIVTVDDIVDVVQEEATEDIQKLGGTQALDAPYLETSLMHMVRKRVGWLAALFLSEMLTTSAMSRFEAEIERAVVLALFIPLIISSGGNSGSQATTLVIRAMALGEVTLGHWWRVVQREFASGLIMGGFLGAIGFIRVELWARLFHAYGPHHTAVAMTVALSVVGVVTWGTLAGSTLPFLLKRLKLDPASASAPFVATLVDVTGIVIYFTTASTILKGTLL